MQLPSLPHFPIHEVTGEVKDRLSQNNIVILQAPPGAGKSTILPLELLNEKFLAEKKMIMLEPRRLAARSVAQRMAALLGEPVGETIGFRIRFETKVSSKTKIEVVTEGILTRMLQKDNALENYSLVIFDEFHERSLHADLSLALCKQAQDILRPELKLLVMSATLDGEQLSAVLNNAPVITSQGKQFPVAIIYSRENSNEPLPLQMARAINKALREQKGDILAFLPGSGEILRTQELLEAEGRSEKIVLLYGDLNFSKQQEAILPDANKRKIILSTSIAETSLTIEGITTVIDSGYSRGQKFDARSGLSKLETFRVTKDTAEQRAGRAGRLGPGVCYRLWTEGTHLQLTANRKPEILEADLSSFMLELYNWGISEVNELNWVTVPPAGNVSQANDLLASLHAVKNNRITPEGKELLKFPTNPRFAHMFLLAKKWDEEANTMANRFLAADIAALLEERDLMGRNSGSDIQDRLALLKSYRNKEFVAADKRLLERIDRLAFTWRKLMELVSPAAFKENDYRAGKLIAAAYPERIAKQIEKNKSVYKLANGKSARLPEHDPLIAEEWLAVAMIDAGFTEGKIFLAAALDANDVKHLADKKTRVQWDERSGKIIAQEELAIGQIAMNIKTVQRVEDELRIKILLQAINKEGLKSFGWNEYCENWQARVMSLRKWNTEEDWPDVREEILLLSIEEWLVPYLANMSSRDEIKKLNWREIADSILSWEMQQKLVVLAPEKLVVPTGSSIQLHYFVDGKSPELHVRLQEVFGMRDTPAINNVKMKVVLHLLSPGYKPVQVTQDLSSFWKNAYHEVRKELQRRYPRHSWPENPLEAVPVRGPKKRNS